MIQSCYSQLRIIYGIKQDGKEVKGDSVVVYISKESQRIYRPTLNKESQYIDFIKKQTVQTLEIDKANLYSFRKNIEFKNLEVKHGVEFILNFPCVQTNIKLRSNSIDVFYCAISEYKGAPGLYLANIPGLVLKVIRNGNYEIYAKQIDTSDGYITESLFPRSNLTELNEAEFQQKLIESRYKTFTVFENEILSFNDSFTKDFTKEVMKLSKGTVVLKKVAMPKTTEHTIVIAEITVRSNGDAYDRTGSVFAIPITDKQTLYDGLKNGLDVLPKYKDGKWGGFTLTENYYPPVELVRFITSFGAGWFGKDIKINGLNWKDSITYRLDVSNIVRALGKNLFIGAFVGNWDKGGHLLSLRLKYFEESEYENNSKWFLPLFSTLNIMEMEGQEYGNIFKTDTLSVDAVIPEGIKNPVLRFITTGHGNDEFTPRMHTVLVDGKEVFKLVPWRTDCGTFRENNPASGNFLNGMSSSDYSRSNWCPGMVVNPYEIRLDGLGPGKHNFKIIIECGDNSYWNVTGTLIDN